jgi:hypothetical protein
MAPPLHAALLRFWRPRESGRVVAGTGFLAAGVDGKAYALTCAHVANLVFDRSKDAIEPLTTGTTTADLIGRGDVTLDLVGWFAPPSLGQVRRTPVADIAVLMPREPFAASFIPPSLYPAAPPCRSAG